MKRLLENWDAVRIIRLILGVAGVAYSIYIQDYFLMALGGIFILQAAMNWSCCSGGCSSSANDKALYKDIVKNYDFNNKNNNK